MVRTTDNIALAQLTVLGRNGSALDPAPEL
eukprot:COSAG01_NODE_392_length_17668_cov_5.382264_5_plen_30_part_00